MSRTKSNGLVLTAAAIAVAAPALLAQPAAGLADYGDYRYRAFLATETKAEKTERTATEIGRQRARVGTSDLEPAAAEPRKRSYHFNLDVPLEEEQHYRE